MTKEELDFIGSMNLCEEISDEAYKKIVCHCREQEPCDNAVSRQTVLNILKDKWNMFSDANDAIQESIDTIEALPPVNPQYTEYEIQKMQDLEQAELEKAYEVGKAEGQECGDAISRQAVLDKKELVELEDGQSFYCISPEDVETLPPVNPQQKTGHWIFDEILDKHYYCSECKSMGVDYWDFCPNCGAKMEAKDED